MLTSKCGICRADENHKPLESVPVDPAFYPEFQYQSQGFLADIFKKEKATQELQQKLVTVLKKYREFEKPYFENFFHVGTQSMHPGESGEVTDFDLFRLVLIRLGFDELEEFRGLLKKLVMTTSFRFLYRDFAARTRPHVKENLESTLKSWISQKGSGFRSDFVLFLYFLWIEKEFIDEISFQSNPPLVRKEDFDNLLRKGEVLYLDILVTRFKHLLENFDPSRFLTIYAIDAMDGFAFEDFLVQLFTTLGYSVQTTRRTGDQGADLFAEQFGRKIVIQAKNYSGNVSNSAVQQVLGAKQFYSCDDAMVVTNSYFTRSARDLAKAGEVRLVDRPELQRYLDDYNRLILEAAQEN
jgi:hypothetical protein